MFRTRHKIIPIEKLNLSYDFTSNNYIDTSLTAAESDVKIMSDFKNSNRNSF